MKAAISFALYLGFGALAHAVIIGGTFDWSSAWTYGLLLAWPVPVGIAAAAISLALWLLLLVAIFCVEAVDRLTWPMRLRRMREEDLKSNRRGKAQS